MQSKPTLVMLQCTAVAILVCTLQVWLPYLVQRSGHPAGDEIHWDMNWSSVEFWDRRCRFELLPLPARKDISSPGLDFVYGTASDRELVVLLDRIPDPMTLPHKEFEVLRLDLIRGSLTTEIHTNKSIERVLNDANLQWPRPGVKRFSRMGGWRRHATEPFLLAGRYCRLTDNVLERPYLPKLLEYRDQKWEDTGLFALIPDGANFTVCSNGDGVGLICTGRDNTVDDECQCHFYYSRDIQFGQLSAALQFDHEFAGPIEHLSVDQRANAGWVKACENLDGDEDILGYWFDNESLCRLSLERSSPGVIGSYHFYRFRSNQVIESRLIQQPLPLKLFPTRSIRWERPVQRSGWREFVGGVNGCAYIIERQEIDGRVQILEFRAGQLRAIAQRTSPLISCFLIECAIFIGVAYAVPMLVLGLLTWNLQNNQRGIPVDTSSPKFASLRRRACARGIDTFLIVALGVAVVGMHRDFGGWWVTIKGDLHDVFRVLQFEFDGRAGWWPQLHSNCRTLLEHLASVPIEMTPLLISIGIFVFQVIWQAKSGKTIGKWLLGITATRSTHKPCGYARSLLRELLCVVDSLLLLSWVPGVICILCTTKSQRLGDLVADTIVVTDDRVKDG